VLPLWSGAFGIEIQFVRFRSTDPSATCCRVFAGALRYTPLDYWVTKRRVYPCSTPSTRCVATAWPAI
jgi:hypothetical protein